jgi:iron complex outermembrane receptor protein
MHRKRRARYFDASLASVTLFAGIAVAALGQEQPEDVGGAIKIYVTGSNIPRSEVESALPVQVLTRDDIERSGAATTPELLSKVSANILGFSDQLAIGNPYNPPRAGLSSANLRGIGDGSTLVLLNGRRVANYAFDGGMVDISAIPLSAIERVEILKDGASAIYGTDAIAGVINFILRKDFHGFEATGYGAWTQHGGADAWQAIASAGYGDLATDKFNAFATASYQRQQTLRAGDRPFSRTGYIPAEGVNSLLQTSFPANIRLPQNRLVNPTLASGCAPPLSIPTNDPVSSTTPFCGYDYASTIDILPPVERTGVVGRATVQVNADNQVFTEVDFAYNRFVFRDAPTAIQQSVFQTNGLPVLYPAGGPYYPTEFAAANGISGPLNLFYRTADLGLRTRTIDTQALRVVAGAEGAAWGWQYGTALTYSENRQTESFASGYVSAQRLLAALATGRINPFGPSGPDGEALLASTQVVGDVHDGKGTTLDFDVKASRDIYQLVGGSLAIALGAEARHEKLDNVYAPAWSSGDLVGGGGNPQSVGGTRTVGALFVEASVPFVKEFEAQIAARYDHYSDFGGTTNPKVAVRWQPARTLLLRTSWGTGFRAPTLYDLYTPSSKAPTFTTNDDPVRCPRTGLPSDCNAAFPVTNQGNPNLEPEKSEQFNAGVVWGPLAQLSFTVDYWKINKSGFIGTLQPAIIFNQFDRYEPTNIIRGQPDPNFPDLPGPITSILVNKQNLGNLHTSGVDVSAKWLGRATPVGALSFGLDGTYVLTWDGQYNGITYTSALGRNAVALGTPGPVPRWKHYATLNWQYGPWGATLAQTYQSGYVDANVSGSGTALPVPPRRVGRYDIWDLQGRYAGFQNATIVLGVKNLMDRAPPFSNQQFTRQVGYDPAYADPRGRVFYAQLTFAFK